MARLKENTENKIKKNFEIISPWLLVLMWMGIIFYFSSQVSGSSDHLSKGIVQRIFDLLNKGNTPITKEKMDFYNHIIRKIAHFIIYLIMGLFSSNAMYHLKVKRKHWLIISMSLCVLYAISDEFHQVFIPGRGPRIFDVMIDSCGALLGNIIYYKLRKVRHSSKQT